MFFHFVVVTLGFVLRAVTSRGLDVGFEQFARTKGAVRFGGNVEQEAARANREWDGRQHSHTSAMMLSARVSAYLSILHSVYFFARALEHVL